MNRSINYFGLAIVFLVVAYLNLPENIRTVDIITLMGAGAAIGALVTAGVSLARNS